MEQPLGDSDDLQPQDLSSTRSLPAVMDLTRKGEECLLKANSMEALRVVKPPSWYPNFPETDHDHRLQPVDQIQPDNAFSNTTVTLSYVSRSHVFSQHSSLSQHPSLYGVPSISRFSTMDGYLQQVDRPLGLAPRSEMFDSIPPAQVVGENVAGVCLMQQSHEINGHRVASNGGVDKYKPQQRGSSMKRTLSQDTVKELQNGQGSSSWSNSAICVDSSPESLTTDMEDGQRASDVLFLISRTEEPVLMQDSRSPRDLCSLNRDYISPLEDPVSPSVSLDDVEDGLILTQASCSPCAYNYSPDNTADTRWDELGRGGPGLSAIQGTRSNGENTPRLDYSKDFQQPGHKPKAPSESIVDLTEDESTVPEVSEKKPKQTAATHLNGNVKAELRTSERKQLPPRSGRGTRLEAIVMNINPNWYKVSTKKPKASKAQRQTNPLTQSSPSKAGVSPNKQTSFVVKNKVQNKAASSCEGETKVHAAASSLTGHMDNIYTNADRCIESTSDSEHARFSKYPHNHSTSPITSSLLFAPDKDSEKESEHRESGPEPSSEVDLLTVSPSLKTSPKKPGKHKAKSTSSEAAAPTAKTRKATPAPKKKRKKPRLDQSSMFSPQEPEIKLKYINYKEEKRDMRVDTFSPFIHIEHKPSSTSPANCTVINYPEEEKPRQNGQGQQQAGSSGSRGFIPGAVPSTSCLQLGRISTHSQHHSSLVCCLCGGSANAMDLGDLHGPYYPEGYRPSTEAPASKPGLKKEEDFSDSDSSCSVKGRGRKCARPPGVPLPHKPDPRLKQEDLLGRWTSDSDPSGSPGAKRGRIEVRPLVTSGAKAAVDDWYVPPVVPLDQCEYWLHEDCSIWSAGVFLVKGRVYGLEEALKVAQETTCSRCHNPGAMLGCFIKGCPNKYHYRCSLQSDCVLNDENFSMKCTKHKNKSFQGPPGSRRDNR